MNIIDIDCRELQKYLLGRQSPVMEYDLIKEFIHENVSLYEKHFSIYHSLYTLKFLAGGENMYLHTDPMRISLTEVPPCGLCRHFFPEEGKYCGSDSSGAYCTLHLPVHEGEKNSTVPDYLSSFYTDRENIAFGESEELRRSMEGFSLFCLKKKEIDRALELFGLIRPDRQSIKSRYRELVRLHHPDLNGGSGEMIREINCAFELLLRALPFISD